MYAVRVITHRFRFFGIAEYGHILKGVNITMKKIAIAVSSAIVAAAMVFAFAGCGKNVDNKTSEPDSAKNASVSVAAEAESVSK